MAKGLCSYCDQPFEKGHRCGSKTTQLFLVEIPSEGDEENGDTNEFAGKLDFVAEELEPLVSMNAMNGATGFHTMRINGYLGKKTLYILINSGSTHNFLAINLAK